MVPALEHLDRHADLNPAFHVLGAIRPVKQGNKLHAQAPQVPRAFVDGSVLPQGLVWLYRVAVAIVLVDVGHFAAAKRGKSEKKTTARSALCEFGWGKEDGEGVLLLDG